MTELTKDFRLNRVFSVPLTSVLLRLPVTPNQVTLASLALGIAAGFLFSKGAYGASLAAAFLYQLACVLDNCDGEIARAKKMSSEFGGWLDITADFATDIALFTGLAFGAADIPGMPSAGLLLFLCLFGACFHFGLVVAEKKKGFGPAVFNVPKAGGRSESVFLKVFDCFREGEASWFVLAFALAGKAHWLLIVGAVYMQFLWAGALVMNLRFLLKRK